MNKVHSLLYKSLTMKIDPLAYLAAFSSLVVGVFFVFFTSEVQDSFLYRNEVLGSTGIWGWSLLLGSVAVLVGLRRYRHLVRVGSMVNFTMWLFACLLYINQQYWYALTAFGLVHVLTQGYFYLVSSIDSLWQERYNK